VTKINFDDLGEIVTSVAGTTMRETGENTLPSDTGMPLVECN